MSILEKEIEGAVCLYARKEYGALTPKFEPDSDRGWPDREIIGKQNRHFFIEFKQKGKSLRPLQEYRVKTLRDYGHMVYVIDDINKGKDAVDAQLRPA